MEQINASTENSVELSEVIAVVEEVSPIAEVTVEEAVPITAVTVEEAVPITAVTVEEAVPITDVIVNKVEEAATIAEVIAAVEEAATIAEVIVNKVEEAAPIAEVIAAVEEAVPIAEVIAAVEEAVPIAEVKVEEAAPIAEVIVNKVEEAAPIAEVIVNKVEEVSTIAEVIAAVEEAVPIAEVIAIVEEAVSVIEVIEKTVEEANSLTPTQKEALDIVFNDVKSTVEHIMIDGDVPIQIKIMQMISPIMKTVQDVSALKLALTGADKKAVVLECGRKCIRMMLKDHQDMLMLYNTIAEPALETMLDLSRNLKSVLKQVEKKEASAECFMTLFSACMSIKK